MSAGFGDFYQFGIGGGCYAGTAKGSFLQREDIAEDVVFRQPDRGGRRPFFFLWPGFLQPPRYDEMDARGFLTNVVDGFAGRKVDPAQSKHQAHRFFVGQLGKKAAARGTSPPPLFTNRSVVFAPFPVGRLDDAPFQDLGHDGLDYHTGFKIDCGRFAVCQQCILRPVLGG